MAKENAIKAKEEREQMNRLEGRLSIMLNNLKKNETPQEYTMAGIRLPSALVRILAHNVMHNSTLTSLHLSRKGILDPEGKVLAEILIENTTLRKLELEGNLLGPNSAREFG